MSPPRATIAESTDAHAALAHVLDGFIAPRTEGPDGAVVADDDLPEPFGGLLAHHEHMTATLGAFHGGAVRLDVLELSRRGDHYGRKIVLRAPDSPQVVEFGIARINLGFAPPAVRDEILARGRPLGEILTRHGVLRRIEPKWYFRLSRDSTFAEAFGEDLGPAVYGRVGTIFCHHQPAIELLEVVSGWRRARETGQTEPRP